MKLEKVEYLLIRLNYEVDKTTEMYKQIGERVIALEKLKGEIESYVANKVIEREGK